MVFLLMIRNFYFPTCELPVTMHLSFSFLKLRSKERMGEVFDWDGTITGTPMTTVVRDQPFYASSLCESRPHWGNMSICPHRYVSGKGTGVGYGNPYGKNLIS